MINFLAFLFMFLWNCWQEMQLRILNDWLESVDGQTFDNENELWLMKTEKVGKRKRYRS